MFRTLALGSLAAFTLMVAAPTVRAEQSAPKDIVDTAVAAGSFKTLAAALDAAGLVGTLKGAGPFTVFAPTDAAFAKLPAGTVEDLLKPENREKLRRILTYHLVPGRVMADDMPLDPRLVSVLNPGTVIRLETPGGGGYGSAPAGRG